MSFLKKLFGKQKQNHDEQIKKVLGNMPYRTLSEDISSEDLMREWQNAPREFGFPVVLVWNELLSDILCENAYGYVDENGLYEFLSSRIEELMSDEDMKEAYMGEESDDADAENGFFEHDGGEVLLVSVPVFEPWQVFEKIPFGSYNECPCPGIMAAFCRMLYEKYGAVPAMITGESLTLFAPNKPTKEEAYDLAMQMFAFCPDIVMQGYESIYALADVLTKSDIWYFWWD